MSLSLMVTDHRFMKLYDGCRYGRLTPRCSKEYQSWTHTYHHATWC